MIRGGAQPGLSEKTVEILSANLIAKVPNQIDVTEEKALKLAVSPDQILLFDPISHDRLKSSGGR